MDTTRFKKIKTLNDIKLEKERLRYEMLAAEHSLHDSLEGIQQTFTMNGLVSRVSTGFLFAQDVYNRFGNIISFFRRKKSS
ncbi:MAG: hypothetical protein RBS53_00165 [Bacteroidales bacterium]|jgi:hypothetical protein|nr:hypothetical protein [Bacteroidales bacterium]NLM92579.1 hypothetical protein [Bacteroidales bacterium]